MENQFPKRKPNRLDRFDYSSEGAYFITICTQHRKSMLWKNEFDLQNYNCAVVGASFIRPQNLPLSNFGKCVYDELEIWNEKYENVRIEFFVIMPNHIHLIVLIKGDENGRTQFAPTSISRMVKQFKGKITKKLGQSIWQKSFYDRIIRNHTEYEKIRKYIYENPLKWQEDDLYSPE